MGKPHGGKEMYFTEYGGGLRSAVGTQPPEQHHGSIVAHRVGAGGGRRQCNVSTSRRGG